MGQGGAVPATRVIIGHNQSPFSCTEWLRGWEKQAESDILGGVPYALPFSTICHSALVVIHPDTF